MSATHDPFLPYALPRCVAVAVAVVVVVVVVVDMASRTVAPPLHARNL